MNTDHKHTNDGVDIVNTNNSASQTNKVTTPSWLNEVMQLKETLTEWDDIEPNQPFVRVTPSKVHEERGARIDFFPPNAEVLGGPDDGAELYFDFKFDLGQFLASMEQVYEVTMETQVGNKTEGTTEESAIVKIIARYKGVMLEMNVYPVPSHTSPLQQVNLEDGSIRVRKPE